MKPEDWKLATEIADSLEEQIKIVDGELSYIRVVKLAIFTADCVKAVTPMYVDDFNLILMRYDTVIEILKGRLNGIPYIKPTYKSVEA